MDKIIEFFQVVNFHQGLMISVAVFIADFITGLTAALRSGRRIKSGVMHQALSKKVSNYFFFLIIGLAFYMASKVGGNDVPLSEIATIIVIIPALPELLSLYENFKIIKSGTDTKPKEE